MLPVLWQCSWLLMVRAFEVLLFCANQVCTRFAKNGSHCRPSADNKRADSTLFFHEKQTVRLSGFEPPRPKRTLGPQPSASANSATAASPARDGESSGRPMSLGGQIWGRQVSEPAVPEGPRPRTSLGWHIRVPWPSDP
jgi:hypothetical protein